MTKWWYYHPECYDKIPMEKRLAPVSRGYPNNIEPRTCRVCGERLTSVCSRVPVGGVKEDVLRKCNICGFEARTKEDLKKFRPISKHYTKTGKHLHGVDPVCKKCHRKRDNKVKVNARIKNPEKLRRRVREYQKKNPKKIKAGEFARKYLKPKKTCENCGSTENLNMHHPDYSRPEYVITLCAACHHKLHAGTLTLSLREKDRGKKE